MSDAPPAPPPPRGGGILTTLLALFLGVVLVAALFALGFVRRERSRPTPDPTRQAAATGLEGQVLTLSDQLERVRELEFRHAVRPEVLGSDELAGEVRKSIREEEFAIGLPHTAVLEAFDMIPEGTDLRQELEDAAAAGVIGFYDPETERLVVESRSDSLTAMGRMTLAHELDHALTDQHFDLERLVTGKEPEDELLARLALAEGDATVAMNGWSQEFLSVEEQVELAFESFGGVFESLVGDPPPGTLLNVMAFPYLDGAAFVEALREEGGWDAVDRAYRDPPTTTEQILHPEKYLEGEDAVAVDVRSSRPGYRRVADGEIGELFLREVLRGESVAIPGVPGFAGGEAADAAAGWAGGGYAVLEGPEGTLVALDVAFDSTADRAEFGLALEGWAEERGASGVVVDATSTRFDLRDGCLLAEERDADRFAVTVFPFACASV